MRCGDTGDLGRAHQCATAKAGESPGRKPLPVWPAGTFIDCHFSSSSAHALIDAGYCVLFTHNGEPVRAWLSSRLTAGALLQTLIHRDKLHRSVLVTSDRVVLDGGAYLGDNTMSITVLERLPA
jgi:hypothetical protein